MTARPRVVFDCMVFLQGAARRNGPAARCVEMALSGTVELLVSPAILEEVADVLTRPELTRKFPTLTPTAVREYIQLITASATLVDPVNPGFAYPRDPDDEPYLNLAIAGSAVTTRTTAINRANHRASITKNPRATFPHIPPPI